MGELSGSQTGDLTVLTSRPATARVRVGGAAIVFTLTLFGSAFLLFLLEPIIAKMVLPLLGGSPSVWNTCVVFFQAMLLAGYAWAHVTTARLGVRRQSIAHCLVMLSPLLVLPITIRQLSVPPSDGSAVTWLLLVLLLSVGLPFFVLSTSSTVLQKWFSATDDPAAGDPYFLYAASNLGSLLALLVYPVLIEPRLTLQQQARMWSIGYGAYIVLALSCALLLWRRASLTDADRGTADTIEAAAAPAIQMRTRLGWVALACVPSSLMLGVTTYLSTDIAPFPLLWIIPLAIYLLTFVVAFSGWSAPATKAADRVLPLVLVPLAMIMVGRVGTHLPLAIVLHLCAFVGAALVCHGRLAATRPPAAHLTEFYLWIAVGGMLGGLFNSLVAPLVFTSVVEYPIALGAACLLRAGVGKERLWIDRRVFALGIPVVIGVMSLAAVLWANASNPSARLFMIVLAVPAVLSFAVARRPLPFAAGFGIILGTGAFFTAGFGAMEYSARTFFGVHRVHVDPAGGYRYLLHGTTLHGLQPLDPRRQHEMLSYYHPTGPVGETFSRLPAARRQRVGAIGLGAGIIAGYCRPEQRWTFFEIDPAVVRIASDPKFFTYLSSCGTRCDVVLGDARLSLARERDGAFDLLVLDAFTSDAIPTHLLTVQALSLYEAKLAPGGALLVQVSNRHLALAPIVARLAAARHLAILHREDRGDHPRVQGKIASEWMLVARTRADFGALADDPNWVTPSVPGSTPLWTDQFSNVLSVLRRPRVGS